jgi:quercetin dioxygenase-like cupin family protein
VRVLPKTLISDRGYVFLGLWPGAGTLSAVPHFVMQRWTLTPVPYPQAPLHIHDRGDEGFVVLDGELDVTLNTEVIRLHAGEFVVVTAGTPHTFATVDDIPASVLVTMSPDIDALVRQLHEVSEEERPTLWARYNSRLV